MLFLCRRFADNESGFRAKIGGKDYEMARDREGSHLSPSRRFNGGRGLCM